MSCQAGADSPLRDTSTIARVAAAAVAGGAVGLRIEGPADVRAVRAETDLPIIGLHKIRGTGRSLITPSLELAVEIVAAGASIVALEVTEELNGADLTLLREASGLGVPIMADVSTLDEGLRAAEAGADIVGTTLSGYTPHSLGGDEPDLALVEALAGRGIRTVAEGRYRTPEQVRSAFAAGADFVVVGGAITDPLALTRRFAAAAPGRSA